MKRGLLAVAVMGLIGGLAAPAAGQALRSGSPAPEIANGRWINSEPLTIGALRGRVVLLDFWTHG